MINVLLLAALCQPVQVIQVEHRYVIYEEPQVVLRNLLEFGANSELLALAVREQINFDIEVEIGMTYQLSTNKGELWCRSTEPFNAPAPRILAFTIQKLEYRVYFELKEDRILIHGILRMEFTPRTRLAACLIPNCRLVRQRLREVLKENKKTFEEIIRKEKSDKALLGVLNLRG